MLENIASRGKILLNIGSNSYKEGIKMRQHELAFFSYCRAF